MKKKIQEKIEELKENIHKRLQILENIFSENKKKKKEKKLFKQQEKDAKKVILFNNSPISKSKEDAFDFEIKAKAIKQAINNKANIIALIGDYGAGKSSLTKLLYKKYWYSFRKPIYINLWDCITKKEKTNNSERQGITDNSLSYFTKSFIYQLSSRNKERTAFSRYINQRLSNNYGKISFSISTKITIFLLFICFTFVIFYFSFKDQNFVSYLDSLFPSDFKDKLFYKIIELLYKSPYLFFLPIAFCGFWALKNNNVLFSLWDSQGKIIPADTDYFEIFKEVTFHLRPRFPFLKRKQLVIIEDLDRSFDCEMVGKLLKELYRFNNLLHDKEKKQFVFIVSLKSEASLNENNYKDGLSLYSKIFDYTVWIRPIHFNNVRELVTSLLISKIGKNKTNQIIDNLFWIMQGSKLTIREMKDRLNETFLLHQSLVNRKKGASWISYNKCAAVVYLQRQYPKDYQKIIENEDVFASIIHKAYYLEQKMTKDDIKSMIEKETLTEDFINTFTKMINQHDIENDYLMYFYNYPNNSYIMNYAEKTIYDYLIHDNYSFQNDNEVSKLIPKIITENGGIVIKKAMKELNQIGKNFGIIFFHFKDLFLFAFQNNQKELCKSYEVLFVKKYEKNYSLSYLCKILNFDISDAIVQKIISISIPLIVSQTKSDAVSLNSARKFIFENCPKYISSFCELCISAKEKLPIISIPVLETINEEETVLNYLDFKRIPQEEITDYLKSLLKFDFSKDDISKILFEKLNEIKELEKCRNIHPVLLKIFNKNKLYDPKYFNIIIDGYINENEETEDLLEYIQTIDYSKMSINELGKIDDLITDGINDVKLVELLEKNNLYLSSINSRIKLNNFSSFDFDSEYLKKNIYEISKQLYEENSESITVIRYQFITNKRIQNILSLFEEPFPFVTKDELFMLEPSAIYYVTDYSRIELDSVDMYAEFCNSKTLHATDLFNYFKSLFFNDEDNCIEDEDFINALFSKIDFTVCKFTSMPKEQQNEIIEAISPVIVKEDADNALSLLRKIKCHIETLDTVIQENCDSNEKLLDDYIDFSNNAFNTTGYYIDFLNDRIINKGLSKETTNQLYKKKYYLPYIIGKTITENTFSFDDNIPLSIYYKAYCFSKSFFELTKNTIIIDKIHKNRLYNKDLTLEKLEPFMKIEKQPYVLVTLIFVKLQSDAERKKYFINIPDLASYKECEKIITLFTSQPYIELVRNDNNFRNIVKEKLYENDDNGVEKKGVLKRQFTKQLNKALQKGI